MRTRRSWLDVGYSAGDVWAKPAGLGTGHIRMCRLNRERLIEIPSAVTMHMRLRNVISTVLCLSEGRGRRGNGGLSKVNAGCDKERKGITSTEIWEMGVFCILGFAEP